MILMAALAAPLLAPQLASADPGGGQVTISPVSNPRPDLVSGGQVLVRVDSPARSEVRVTANGQDVTSAFHQQPNGSLLGLVTGLHTGSNDITAAPAGHGGH